MKNVSTARRLFRLFAAVLDYPGPALLQTIRQCHGLASPTSTEAAALLGTFEHFVERTPLAQLEELYTRTFELDASCHPYVGHHIFGESYKRSALLVGLKEQYKAHGFVVEKELPDHLAVMLRFLAVCKDEALSDDIVREALIPALERMMGKRKQPAVVADGPGEADGNTPQAYSSLLQALHMVLCTLYPEQQADPAQAPLAPAGR